MFLQKVFEPFKIMSHYEEIEREKLTFSEGGNCDVVKLVPVTAGLAYMSVKDNINDFGP